jgi:fimbrial chaperone protein
MRLKSYQLQVIAAFLFVFQAGHADISINPVRLQIEGDRQQRSTTLSIAASEDDHERTYEINVSKWQQNDKGEDILESDPNIIISPTAMILKPSTQRVVRIGFQQPIQNMQLKSEESWRVFFKEVSTPMEQQMGVSFKFNFSIPLFVGKGFKPNVIFHLNKDKDHKWALQAQNTGTGHIQILNLDLIDKNGKSLVSIKNMKYILAGKQFDFPLTNLLDVPKSLKVRALTDLSPNPILYEITE